MKNKVTLYIATHNKTGKKYFGKTTRYFTQEDLQEHYHGSGTYWKNYLKKHSDDVTMEIYGIYDLDENSENYVEPIALKFSKDNNIVEDYDKWANQIEENGLDGGNQPKGFKHTEESKNKMSETKSKLNIIPHNKGIKMSSDFCKKMKFIQNNPTEKILKGRESRKEKMKDYVVSEETKKKLSESCKKYIKTEEHRKNLSESLKGNKVSDKTKKKLSDYMTGRKRGKYNSKIVTCPHCLKEGKKNVMNRWHFDNCKYK